MHVVYSTKQITLMVSVSYLDLCGQNEVVSNNSTVIFLSSTNFLVHLICR